MNSGQFLRSAALAALVSAGFAESAWSVELHYAIGAVGNDVENLRQMLKPWEEATGNTVTVVPMPASTSDQFGQYRLWLAAGNKDIDLYQTDVIWAPQLAGQLVDLKEAAKDLAAQSFPAIVESQTVDGRLVALPLFTDAPALYYRKDLLEKHGAAVPKTWAELTETAARIQEAERAAGDDDLWGFVWQGNAYEGLTCNALEWIASQGGGRLIGADGAIALDAGPAAEALALAKSWIGTIAPEGVLTYMEDEARGVFQSGQAVFMRNWPYVWALANAEGSTIAGKVGLAPLPAAPGEPHTGVLGGAQLAVSRYSKHPEIAADLVRALTGAQVQKARAIEAGFNPTRPALYNDADVLAANPHYRTLAGVLDHALARPSRITGMSYNRVSSTFWNAVHDVLSGRTDADKALSQLQARLHLIRGEGWER